MTVVGYVFLQESATDSTGQRENIEKYAASLGLKVDYVCVEEWGVMQRALPERKAGRRMLDLVEPGDIIVADKAKWILGSAKDGLRLLNLLREREVSLYCVDLEENLSLPTERILVVSEGGSELVGRLLEALAALESNRHGESIKAAKQQMKKEGKYLGGPVPFGWKVDDGYLQRDPDQQHIIEQIRQMRADRWSYRDIAGKLKKKGIRLSHEGIRKILKHNQSMG